MTIGRQWAWKPDDDVKSLEQCLQNLVRSAGGDGNLLFNVGPRSDGTIEPVQAARLKEMGDWLAKYGFSIYGTRGGPFKPADWGVSTRKGNMVYLHILKWSGDKPAISLPDFGSEIKKCTLADGGKVKFRKTAGFYVIEFDGKLLKPVNTILEIEYSGNVMNVKPMDVMSQSISYMKNVTGSSNQKAQWINHQWVDLKAVNNGDWSGSFWQPAGDDKEPWMEFDLGKPESISKAVIYESGNNVRSYELQYKSGDAWKTFFKGTTIGQRAEVTFKPVEARSVRLLVSSYTGTLQIYEVMFLK
jgi:alpha-L-fucosidase